MHTTPDITWRIESTRDETDTVRSLILSRIDGAQTHFIAGQYLTVRLPGFFPSEGKCYSIASTPDDKYVMLAIKRIGAFSQALLDLSVGDTLTTSAPYGFFYPDLDEQRELVFVVSGIGITPCMSIIRSLLMHAYPYPITLHYGNRTTRDIVFKDTLDSLAHTHTQFSIHHYISREAVIAPHVFIRRMESNDLIVATNDPHNTDFFICGSTNFTKSMWSGLREKGIAPSQIFTEGFF